jgi:hypothetical protein
MEGSIASQEETMGAVAVDQAEMLMALSTALSIGIDGSLQDRLRTIAGAGDGQPFLVGQLRNQAWLEVSTGTAIKVHRKQVERLPWVGFDQALTQDSGLSAAVERALVQTSAVTDARKLIEPLLDAGTLPSRDEIRRLREWSPLLEQLAYRCGTRISTMLDNLRPHILRGPARFDPANPASPLTMYWTGAHVMGNLLFLASETEARPWLSDMAAHFQWKVWTPTFPLLRERTIWLAACAARSAIAFGQPVVDKYLSTLSAANHPMKAIDALFGLSAIALADPAASKPIALEIQSLRDDLDDRDVSHREYFEQAFDDAQAAIVAGKGEVLNADSRALGWRPKSKHGLATSAALRGDPSTITRSRRYLGFAALPTIVAARPDNYYPATSKQRGFLIAGSEQAEIFARAWGPSRSSGVTGRLS